jgi:hypothetical protein
MTYFRQIEANRCKAAIIADYNVQSAVERELVLRLASVLWRLRRTTTMETGLLQIQADHLLDLKREHQSQPINPAGSYSVDAEASQLCPSITNGMQTRPSSGSKALNRATDLATCFFYVWPICQASHSTGSAGTVSPSRPDHICSRCVRSSQTTGALTPFHYW